MEMAANLGWCFEQYSGVKQDGLIDKYSKQ